MILGHWLTYKVTRQSRDNASEALSIVKGNGRGDVVTMLRDVQDAQDRHGEKLDAAVRWQIDHERDHMRML
jgi:hypothetical protein